jgi:hypothetical protein
MASDMMNAYQTVRGETLHEIITQIMQLKVGEDMIVEDHYLIPVCAALKTQALGGRRFQTFQSPDHFETSVRRLDDSTQVGAINSGMAQAAAQAQHDVAMANARAQTQAQMAAIQASSTATVDMEIMEEDPHVPKLTLLQRFLLRLPFFSLVEEPDEPVE